MNQIVIYKINRPYSKGFIEVYCIDGSGAYEYTICDEYNCILVESTNSYGVPEIALKEALIHDSEN